MIKQLIIILACIILSGVVYAEESMEAKEADYAQEITPSDTAPDCERLGEMEGYEGEELERFIDSCEAEQADQGELEPRD